MISKFSVELFRHSYPNSCAPIMSDEQEYLSREKKVISPVELLDGFLNIFPDLLDIIYDDPEKLANYKRDCEPHLDRPLCDASTDDYGVFSDAPALDLLKSDTMHMSVRPVGVMKTNEYARQFIRGSFSPSRLVNGGFNSYLSRGVAQEARIDDVVGPILAASPCRYALLGRLTTIDRSKVNKVLETNKPLLYIPGISHDEHNAVFQWMNQQTRKRQRVESGGNLLYFRKYD